MRRTLSIALFILYLAAVFRPLFPFVDYWMNKQYIATTLCENRDKPKMHCCGKCHLMKQLAQAADQDPKAPAPNRADAKESFAATHTGNTPQFGFSPLAGDASVIFLYSENYFSVSPSGIFHPPKSA